MKRVLLVSLITLVIGVLITGSYLLDKNPMTKSAVVTGFDQKQPAPYVSNLPIVYTDNFDGANDTTALKARGYKVWYRGTGPQGLTATWFTPTNPPPFPAYNGPTTGYVAANYNAVTGTNNIDSWLVLPRLSGGIQSGDSLYFYSRAPDASAYPDSIRVMYSANDSIPEGTWTELGRFKVTTGGSWQLKGFRAPSSSANGRFAVRYCVVGGGPSGLNSDFIGIDAMTIVSAPVVCSYLWGTQTSGVTNLLQAAWASSGLVAWVAGAAGTVRKTTDGGTTWTNGNPNPGIINGDIYCINALDVNNALVTTSPGSTFIYRTTNGGTNWTQVFTQATPGFIDAMIMKDANTGFAYGDPVGARWSLWKTVNGGATWDSTGLYLAQVGSEAGWNNSMCIIGNDIWFGTNNTKVYHSTNFGATGSWTAGVTTGNVSTYGVWFTSATNGMCVGTIVQVTTNGGTTWTNGGAPGGAGNMTSVGGSGTNFWLTRGTNVYGSTDFGATWTGAAYTGTQALWATNITTGANGCLTGWSSGATGTIVKLTGNPVAVNNNHNEVPNAYMLEQNYPNPFNPSTTIMFALPKAGNVEIRVYDILGRETAVLVNEFRQAGNYSVDFNASQLASGIYFYTIKSGDFTDSKKMMLIK